MFFCCCFIYLCCAGRGTVRTIRLQDPVDQGIRGSILQGTVFENLKVEHKILKAVVTKCGKNSYESCVSMACSEDPSIRSSPLSLLIFC